MVYVIQQRAGSRSSSQAVSKSVWHIPLLCVQWKTPDDGQRNCPKHVEFYSKNKFEKLVYLVGFIIRIYHDARSPERQKTWIVYIFFKPNLLCGTVPLFKFWSHLSLLLDNCQQASLCSSASPDLPKNLWNTIFHYCVNNSLPLFFFLSQLNPFHYLSFFLRSIYCYSHIDAHDLQVAAPLDSFPSVFFLRPMRAICPVHYTFPSLITRGG